MTVDKLANLCIEQYNNAKTPEARVAFADVMIAIMEERIAEYSKMAKGPEVPKVKKQTPVLQHQGSSVSNTALL